MGALEDAQRERRMRERDRQIEAEIKRREAYVPPAQRVKQAAQKIYATAKPAVISVARAAEKATRPPARRRRAPARRAAPRRAAPRRAPRRAAPKRRKPKRDPWDLGIRI